MFVKAAVKRVGELYSEGGVSEVARGVRDYIRMDLGTDPYSDRRSDNDERWKFISSHFSDSDTSLIDVGCAEGEFVSRAAKHGMTATGYDLNVKRITAAKKRHSDLSEANFEVLQFDPENISDLPEVDVILFLTIHHHWESFYNVEKSIDMFKYLLDRCEKLFYEPPGHLKMMDLSTSDALDPDVSVEWYRSHLNELFGDEIRVVDHAMFDYKEGKERKDPLFYIDCSEFSLQKGTQKA